MRRSKEDDGACLLPLGRMTMLWPPTDTTPQDCQHISVRYGLDSVIRRLGTRSVLVTDSLKLGSALVIVPLRPRPCNGDS